MRTTARLDRRAIGDWINTKGVEDQRQEVMTSLSALPTGTGWVWAPELGILQRTTFRPRRTFDSSATPQLAAHIAEPTSFAPVD